MHGENYNKCTFFNYVTLEAKNYFFSISQHKKFNLPSFFVHSTTSLSARIQKIIAFHHLSTYTSPISNSIVTYC